MADTKTDNCQSVFNVTETQSLLEKWEIPISHLDYGYINGCQNDKELEKIVRILRSGQEGSYPDLLKTAEQRLTLINPESKYLRVTQSVLTKSTCGTEEWVAVSEDLEKWEKDINVLDEDLQNSKNLKTKSNLPEIRKIEQASKDHNSTKMKPINRIKSWDYDAWDKYDPDVELLKEDLEEEQRKKEQQRKEAREAFERNKKSVSFNTMENLTETESTILANREKDLGNECYRAKDYAEAKKYYSNSIKLKATAVAYNNRCITNIKLKKYDEALEDCKQVLKREPDNIKALLRRAQIFKDLNEYSKAYDSLEELIQIDPNNTVAQNLMNDVRKKLPICEKQQKTRLKITEIENNNQNLTIDAQTKEHLTQNKTKTKKVIVPIPSTSTFNGPNVKIVEVEETKTTPETMKPVSILKNKNYDFKHLDRNKPVKKLQIKPKLNKSVETKVSENKPLISESNRKNEENENSLKIVEINSNCEDSYEEILNNVFANVNDCNQLEESHKNIELINEISKTEPVKAEINNNFKSVQNIDENPNANCLNLDSVNGQRTSCSEIASQESDNNENVNLIDEVARSRNIVEDATVPNRPIKIDRGSCGEPYPNEETANPIVTPYEFTKAWQAIRDRNDTQSRAKVLRRIPPTYLSTVISNKLDGPMLSTILKCLQLHFTVANDIETVEMFLTEITRIPRFDLITMFMDVEDQKSVKNLIVFLKQHGRNLPNNIIKLYGIIHM